MTRMRKPSKRTMRLRAMVDPTRDWTVDTTWKAPSGRILTPGTEVSIRGARGRFRFQQHVTTADGVEWIDVIGGVKGCPSWRSFRPDRIRTVHRDRRTLSTAEAIELAKRKRVERREAA